MTAQRQRISNPKQDDKSSIVEEEDDLELPLFDTNTIATATNNFSFTNKIGEGGFGPVYKVISHYIYELIVGKASQCFRTVPFSHDELHVYLLSAKNIVLINTG